MRDDDGEEDLPVVDDQRVGEVGSLGPQQGDAEGTQGEVGLVSALRV